MFNPSQHPGERQSVVHRSVQGFGTCVALIAALLAVPKLHDLTGAAVGHMAAASYGPGMASFVESTYYFALFPTVFFLLRAMLAALILMGATKIATRFL